MRKALSRDLLALGAAGALLGVTGVASARPEHPSVVVWTEGLRADVARAEVDDALGDDVVVVEAIKLRDALGRQGQRGPIAPALQSAKTRGAALDRVRRAMRASGVDAVVLVVTSRAFARGDAASMMIVDAEASDVPEPTSVSLAPGDGDLRHVVRAAFPPPPPPPPPAVVQSPTTTVVAPPDPPRDEAASAARSPRHTGEVGQELVQLSAGGGVGMRRFDYTDGLTRNLRNYQLGAAPLVSVEGAVFPFVASGTPVLRDLGVFGGYSRSFALQSTSDTGTVDTQWSRYFVGGQVRLRTGGEGSPVLALTGAYGDESFGFSGSPAPSLPSVDYRFVRTGADVRVPIGRFSLFARGGYLFVLSAGDVAARFPHATVGGIDAELGGAVTLVPGLEARVTASYRRFFYSMNPTPGDGYVAGGALDELGGLLASVAYVY
jgi:hypothetical protein